MESLLSPFSFEMNEFIRYLARSIDFNRDNRGDLVIISRREASALLVSILKMVLVNDDIAVIDGAITRIDAQFKNQSDCMIPALNHE